MNVNENSGKNGPVIIACALLFLVTLATYQQALKNDFITYDDVKYLTANPHVITGVTLNNVSWAFTSTYAANWHPVTWLSHMLDAQIYGMKPYGHHLTSILIHALSSVVLFLFFVRTTNSFWQSLLISLLFALHPLHIQSVAWASERKDVLSALFGFASLFLYARYAGTRKSACYACSLGMFLLGLMSKPMIVTLPLLMLLMDCWPLRRYGHDGPNGQKHAGSGNLFTLIREKIPFFILSLFSCIITMIAQNRGGAIQSITNLSFGLRMQNAIDSYVRYIYKTFYPIDLAVFYPLRPTIPLWQTMLELVLIVVITVAAVRMRQRSPFLAVGWLWFLLSLVPVIGIIQIGDQSIADRYMYIPIIGLFIMAVWGVPQLLHSFARRTMIFCVLSSFLLIAMTTMTWQQLRYWKDSISLFQRCLQVAGDSYTAHDSLGCAYYNQGNYEMAIQEFNKLIRMNPLCAVGHNRLGLAFAWKNELKEAVRELAVAVQLKPDNYIYHNDLGYALACSGNVAGAINEFTTAISLNRDYFDAHRNLGFAYYNLGRYTEAYGEFSKALAIYPTNNEVINMLKSLSATTRPQ